MGIRSRWLFGSATFFLFTALPLLAQSPPLTNQFSNWDNSFNVRTWTGYKDNVLLGSQRVQDSVFVAGGLDAMLFRLPVQGTEFYMFATADYIRFLDAKQVDQEIMVIAQTQLKKRFENDWAAGVGAHYLYFDQVFDASAVEREFPPLEIRGQSAGLTPFVRKDLAEDYWAELGFKVERQMFKKFLDDYWEGGPKAEVGRQYGRQSDIALAYEFSRRIYDTRTPRTRLGQTLSNESLVLHQHDVELVWRHHWDEAKRWRTQTRAGIEINIDNGEGYYDYLRYRLGEGLRYRDKIWEFRFDISLYHYDYDLQPLTSTDLTSREKTTVSLDVRGQRTLIHSLKGFARYEHERSLSNLDSDEYAVNTVSAGIDWEF